MVPNGGNQMNGRVFQGPYCGYDASRSIAVNLATDLENKLFGAAE